MLWIAQGSNAAKVSAMCGHPVFAVLGTVAVIIGLFLLAAARRVHDIH
jgi:hypothetical protein